MLNRYFSQLTIILLIIFANSNIAQENIHTEQSFNDVPEWSKSAIWYQIFIERFRNGDFSNDPTSEDINGAYPGFVPENWKTSEWTSDWYKHDDYFKDVLSKKDKRGFEISNFNQLVQLRRYGGDLQGVMEKMNYIDELGVNAIYFNPLNDAPSLHKYDARNWRHIDPTLGPNPKHDKEIIASENPIDPSTWKFTTADSLFLRIIDEFHKRGIKVILDYSWNHTGKTFWAFQDIMKKGKDSEFSDWFWIEQYDDPNTPENEFNYQGWLNIPDLPEIKETVRHIIPPVKSFEGDIFSEQVKEHIFNITMRWLDPNGDGNSNDGVDGFRLDVAAEVPLGFWRDYREVVRSVNPDAYLIGEVWWEDFPDKLLDPKPFLEGDVFDAVMNYRWYRSARHFFNQSPNKIKVSEFIDSLNSYVSNLRKQNQYSMMNLTSSHDVPRVSTSLYNRNKYKYNASALADSNYKINKPDEKTYETLNMILVHQFTYVGAPHIWAGDEMGMWGSDDPDTRKPLIWNDMEFEDETHHPLNIKRPVDKVRFNFELNEFYKMLIKIYKENSELALGDLQFLVVDDENEVLAYTRFMDNYETIAVFNTSESKKEIEFSVKHSGVYKNLLDNEKLISNNNKLKIILPARKSAIISN